MLLEIPTPMLRALLFAQPSSHVAISISAIPHHHFSGFRGRVAIQCVPITGSTAMNPLAVPVSLCKREPKCPWSKRGLIGELSSMLASVSLQGVGNAIPWSRTVKGFSITLNKLSRKTRLAPCSAYSTRRCDLAGSRRALEEQASLSDHMGDVFAEAG